MRDYLAEQLNAFRTGMELSPWAENQHAIILQRVKF